MSKFQKGEKVELVVDAWGEAKRGDRGVIAGPDEWIKGRYTVLFEGQKDNDHYCPPEVIRPVFDLKKEIMRVVVCNAFKEQGYKKVALDGGGNHLIVSAWPANGGINRAIIKLGWSCHVIAHQRPVGLEVSSLANDPTIGVGDPPTPIDVAYIHDHRVIQELVEHRLHNQAYSLDDV